jgi:hypothetical protein
MAANLDHITEIDVGLMNLGNNDEEDGIFIRDANLATDDIKILSANSGRFKISKTIVGSPTHNEDANQLVVKKGTPFFYKIDGTTLRILVGKLEQGPRGIEPKDGNNDDTKTRKKAVFNTWRRGKNHLPNTYNEFYSKGGKHSYRRKSSRKSKKSRKTRKPSRRH